MLGSRSLSIAGAVLLATVGLTGCGSKSSSSSSTTTAPVTTTTVTTASSPTTASGDQTSTDQGAGMSSSPSAVSTETTSAAASSASGGASSRATGECSAKQTSATIGGAHKCIEPGQMCSSKHVSDYTQYGFVCEQSGNRWVLRKA